MSYERVCKCDNCGQIKGEANHWFVVAQVDSFISFAPVEYGDEENSKHLCGQKCAIEVLSRHLTPAVAKEETQHGEA